jgi:uncharacterized membrane protein YraQ (UPF0718 family)
MLGPSGHANRAAGALRAATERSPTTVCVCGDEPLALGFAGRRADCRRFALC